MATAPILIKWSQLLSPDETDTFVIETTALRTTNTVYAPVLRFHNIGTEDAELKIEYNLDLGVSTDDPLNSGSYTNTVVDVTVPGGAMYTYDFDGIHLESRSGIVITHEVTIKNVGIGTRTFHTILAGYTEVQTQLSAGQYIGA